MDFSDLKTFLKVAETGSFSLAAAELHVTQPAVSKRLANLEQAFGTPLIERLPRQARLTEAGLVLKTKAENIIREVENTQALISNLDQQISGTLRLATSHHIGLHRLPACIRSFVREFPDVVFDLRFVASEEAAKSVLDGEVELALITLPEAIPNQISAETIWVDRLRFVCAPDHPLAAVTSPTLSDLTCHRALLPASHTVTFEKISALFKRADLELQPAMPTNYLETIKMMVSVGLGWGVLPESMIDSQLRVLPVDPEVSRSLGAITDQRRQLSNTARTFLELMRARS